MLNLKKCTWRVVLSLAVCGMPFLDAAALTWEIEDGAFEDGRTIFGSFDFDANTLTYSRIDITVAATNFSFTYTDDNTGVSGTTGGAGGAVDAMNLSLITPVLPPFNSNLNLFLSFAEMLTNNATQSIALITGFSTVDFVPGPVDRGSYESAEFLYVSNLVSGSVSPVPLPIIWPLFAMITLALARVKRIGFTP